MKITDIETGLSLQLYPDTQIEIERTNPFFNEYGEQSYPLDIPCSDINSKIFGFPERIDIATKVTAKRDMYISDGSYAAPCRAAVLSARRNADISITLYINNGSFYSRLQSTSLKSIFQNESIPGVSNVSQALEFCKSLIDGNNEMCAIFPVLIDETHTEDILWLKGQAIYRYLNRLTFNEDNTKCDFYNAVEREETINDNKIFLPPGFYITPFLRLNYILKRVFSHFGYSLLDSVLNTSPLRNIVIINNVMDSIVNGIIRLEQLLPDKNCSDLFNLIRKKFCCEFIPDEINKTVEIVFFKDIPGMTPDIDITTLVSDFYSVEYPADYKRIVLKSESKVSSDLTPLDFNSLKQTYPVININSDGAMVSEGFAFINNLFAINTIPFDYIKIHTKIAECSSDYDTGQIKSALEIIIPECIPEPRGGYVINGTQTTQERHLFIGNSRALNSKIVLSDGAGDDSGSSSDSIPFMLAYAIPDIMASSMGTVVNTYSRKDNPDAIIRFSDYALTYNGSDGIFEKFWRPNDTILRNAKDVISANLLLAKENINNISSFAPLLLAGQKIMPDKLSYSLGLDEFLKESRFYTVDIKSPADIAPGFDSFASSSSEFVWVPRFEYEFVSKSQYENHEYKDAKIINVYPPLPDFAAPGVKFYTQKSCINFLVWGELAFHNSYALVTVWLEAFRQK